MSEKIVDYDQLYPGRFLKAGEFNGKPVTLTITDVDIEDLPQDKGGDRARGIISFRETKRQLVLNRTNGECIKAMFGRVVPEWIGKRVTFHPVMINFGGAEELAIRVKGSPDIAAPIAAEVKLPRRKPFTMRMEVTALKAKGDGL
jgi:hypothetical protein